MPAAKVDQQMMARHRLVIDANVVVSAAPEAHDAVRGQRMNGAGLTDVDECFERRGVRAGPGRVGVVHVVHSSL